MRKMIAAALSVVVFASTGTALAGNPSGATPHQYRTYCASIHGTWVSNMQTCNGVPLSVWA
jgi:hypothetical protein